MRAPRTTEITAMGRTGSISDDPKHCFQNQNSGFWKRERTMKEFGEWEIERVFGFLEVRCDATFCRDFVNCVLLFSDETLPFFFYW